MSRSLEGQVAIVTGSDSGIGQASAIAFAEQGADLVVLYLEDAAGAADTGAAVEAAGGRALIRHCDVSDEDAVKEVFSAAMSTFGRVDILMNCAGRDASGKPVDELPTDVWDHAIRVNLYGAMFFCREFIKLRKAAGGGGKIINVTSVHDLIPRAGAADYDCSKSALAALTRTLALELAPHRINVNNIGPGMVLTPMNQQAVDDPRKREEQVQSIPFKRAAEPSEIAGLAVFLASKAADYVTGSTYYMDGGLMQNLGQGA